MAITDEKAARWAWAVLRAGIIPLVLAGVALVDHKYLLVPGYVLAMTTVVGAAWAGWMLTSDEVRTRFTPNTIAIVDMLFLSALTFETGGPLSQVRKAFFILPLVAAMVSTPRATARWAAMSVVAYVAVTIIHPTVDGKGGIPGIAAHALYLSWAGVASTMLSRLAYNRQQQLRELADTQQLLVRQTLQAEANARRDLAYTLHDDAMQNLLAARRDLPRALGGDAESESRVKQGLTDASAQLRSAISDLHPHTLEYGDLSDAVTQLAQTCADRAGFEVSVDIDDGADVDRQTAYALIRELVLNAERHSQASHVSVAVKRQPDGTLIRVADNGVGIPATRRHEALAAGHVGLASLQARTEGLGGTLSIATPEDGGVLTEIALPRS